MPSYPLKWNEKNNNISTEKIDLLREENVQLKNKVSKLEKRVESLEKEFENLLINIEWYEMIEKEIAFDENGERVDGKYTLSSENIDNITKDVKELIQYIEWSFKYIPNADSNKQKRAKRVLEIQNNFY